MHAMGARVPSSGLTRRTFLRVATGVTTGLAVGELAYGSLYARHHLHVARETLRSVHVPPALDGLRIGLISDTHHSYYTSLEFIAHAVALVNDARPDLVVLGGDYVTRRSRTYTPQAATPFAALRSALGTFAVLGNHDDDVEVPRALTRQGVQVLRDARTRLEVRGERLDLIGVHYWTRRVDAIERLARGRAPLTLLLAHDPRRLWEASALGIPFVLSGHTHGGQVSLPLLGPVAARKYPVPAGLRTDAATTLFVSRGVGTVLLPTRLDCPPDVAVLTLRRGVPGA